MGFQQNHAFTKGFFFIPALFVQTAVTSKQKKLPQIRWCQNSRIVEGFHPLFHESDLVPLFHPLSASFVKEGTFSGCSRWAKVGHFGPKHAPGTLFHHGEKNLLGRRPSIV